MSRLKGALVKRVQEIEKAMKEADHVEFRILDKDSEEVLKTIKPRKRAAYCIEFRI